MIQEVEDKIQKVEMFSLKGEPMQKLKFLVVMVSGSQVQSNLQLWLDWLVGCINDEPVTILINLGSFHSFLSQEMVDKANCNKWKPILVLFYCLMMVLGPLIVECFKP